MANIDDHLLAKIGQYGLIINDKGEVLVLQRSRSKTWSLPGGRLDKEERNWKKAFIREIKEETNLKVTEVKPFDIKIIEDKWQVKYCVYFKCGVESAEDIRLSSEHDNYKWVSNKDLNQLPIEDEPRVNEVLLNIFTSSY